MCGNTIAEAFVTWYRYDYLYTDRRNRIGAAYNSSSYWLFADYWKSAKQPYAVLYRGMSFFLPYEQDNLNHIITKLQIGVYSDRGFYSTSLDPQFAIDRVTDWHIDVRAKYGQVNLWDIYLIFEDAEGVFIDSGEDEVVIFNPVYKVIDIQTGETEDGIIMAVTLQH